MLLNLDGLLETPINRQYSVLRVSSTLRATWVYVNGLEFDGREKQTGENKQARIKHRAC